MSKIVVFVDNGMVQEIFCDDKKSTEVVIVDFDRKTLDQSIVKLLDGPYEFGEVAALADIYSWKAAYDPQRVAEIFNEKRALYGK